MGSGQIIQKTLKLGPANPFVTIHRDISKCDIVRWNKGA
jgi:hypothetical protein